MIFSNEGLVLPLYETTAPSWLSIIIMPPSPQIAFALYLLLLASLFCFLCGIYYRVATSIALLLGLYFWQLQLHVFAASFDRILFFCLLILLFSGAGKTFSFDQKRLTGSMFNWEPISILPHRIITLQISATFFGVGLQKWWLPDWVDGTILYQSFISRWGSPLAYWYANLPLGMGHYDFVVLLVKIIQPVVAVGVWFKLTRLPSVLLISVFLTLVASMLTIWWFLFIIPACILYFDQESVLKWCRRHISSSIPEMPLNSTK
ncbi:MAG: hypothetical protein QF815_03375 [Candidatus Peribacteraceae bacterium]|nr:hypothetical protein [Candidatus Peribacteraceae bacterium]